MKKNKSQRKTVNDEKQLGEVDILVIHYISQCVEKAKIDFEISGNTCDLEKILVKLVKHNLASHF